MSSDNSRTNVQGTLDPEVDLVPSGHQWIVRVEGGPQRVNHAAVAIGNLIFSFGGFCTGGDYASREPIDVFVLNIDTFQWQKIAAPEKFTQDVPFQRYGHTVFAYGKNVYLFGGRNDNGACNRLFRFDTEKLRWTRIETSGVIPGPRDGHSSCRLGSQVYIFGGFEETTDSFSNDIYALDLDTFVWRYIEPHGVPPSHRDFHSACAIGTDLYIFGGRGNRYGPYNAERTRDIYCRRLACFDTIRNEWHYPEQHGEIPTGRRSHSCFVYEGEMYIFGGYNSMKRTHYGDMLRYEPKKQMWSKVTLNIGRVGPPCPRRRQTSIIVGDRLYVFGGTSPVPVEGQDPALAWMNVDEELVDHNDLYVLDFKPSLKTLCLSAVIAQRLNARQLPICLQKQISEMTRTEPRSRQEETAG